VKKKTTAAGREQQREPVDPPRRVGRRGGFLRDGFLFFPVPFKWSHTSAGSARNHREIGELLTSELVNTSCVGPGRGDDPDEEQITGDRAVGITSCAEPVTYLSLVFGTPSKRMHEQPMRAKNRGWRGTALGTLVMPYCSGLGYLLFVWITPRRRALRRKC